MLAGCSRLVAARPPSWLLPRTCTPCRQVTSTLHLENLKPPKELSYIQRASTHCGEHSIVFPVCTAGTQPFFRGSRTLARG